MRLTRAYNSAIKLRPVQVGRLDMGVSIQDLVETKWLPPISFITLQNCKASDVPAVAALRRDASRKLYLAFLKPEELSSYQS